jgi:hypothetical protein
MPAPSWPKIAGYLQASPKSPSLSSKSWDGFSRYSFRYLGQKCEIYCVTDTRVQHFNKVLIISDFVKHDRLQFEGSAWFVYHECNGLNVGESRVLHDVGRSID